MKPLEALRPWKKTLRQESKGVPTGRHPRKVRTQAPRHARSRLVCSDPTVCKSNLDYLDGM